MKKVLLILDTSEDYSRRLLKGIVSYAKGKQWSFVKMPTSFREKYGPQGLVEWIQQWKPDGIIAQLNNEEDFHGLIEKKKPLVVIDYKERFRNIPNITGGYIETGQMAAEYFINKGFTNFAFYGFTSFIWSREREYGYVEFLKKKGFNAHLFNHADNTSVDVWYYNDEKLCRWLKELPKPVAIFCCDDNQSLMLQEICHLHNIVIPSEVALLGVDNDETLCKLSDPSLSSIMLNVEKGGFESARLLHTLMCDNQATFYDISVEPLCVITRQSTEILATNDTVIRIVLDYIHKHLPENIKVDDLVTLVPLSRRALEKRFRNITSESIYSYILKQRIARFCNGIDSNTSIQAIAYDVGFTDFKNFSRVFKKEKGMSPSEFRTKNMIAK